MKRACKDCEFCAAPAGEDQLQCRRKSPPWAMHYPMPHPDKNQFVMLAPQNSRVWPRVNPDDWCGEFQPRDAGPELARPDPLDSVRVRQLSCCFAELSQVDADAEQDAWMVMRTKHILRDVARIIDLPAAVDALKKKQEG